MKELKSARRTLRWCVALTVGAGISVVVGLCLPFVRIVPGANLEPLSGFAVWFLSDEESYSLLQSVIRVWQSNVVLGAVAFVFSLVTPFVKLGLLTVGTLQTSRSGHCHHSYHRWAERLGPWSMLEVFLLALVLLATQTLPAGTQMVLLPGFYAFVSSIIFSLSAAMVLPVGADTPTRCRSRLRSKPIRYSPRQGSLRRLPHVLKRPVSPLRIPIQKRSSG